jgi:hypothetical protein
MEIGEYAVAGFALIGLVNGLNFVLEKKWDSFFRFMLAITAGAVFGFLGWFGLPSAEIGLLVGLGSSGLYKTATVI